MSGHINEAGQFQSDKHPDLAPDKIVLSFKDPVARAALHIYVQGCQDTQLAQDIHDRLESIVKEDVKT